MNEYMPIGGTEITDLQFIHSLYRIMEDADSLKPRMTMVKRWWQWRGAIKLIRNIFADLWNTIEPEKRNQINRVWAEQEIQIVNVGKAVDPTGDFMKIPKKAILHWGQHCQRESCAMCMGNHNDRKDCLFRKGMAEMAIPDLRKIEKQSGKCMGKLFNWED